MIKQGYVVYVDNNLCTFNLMYVSSSSCSKGCQGCSAATDRCDVESYGPFYFDKQDFNVENGDLVDVEVFPKTHLIPAFLLLILPLLVFFISYAFYTQLTLNIFVVVTITLIISYILTLLQFNKKWKTITKGEVIKVEK